jgi:formylglycine-generating enzyme required for sulfatase activity
MQMTSQDAARRLVPGHAVMGCWVLAALAVGCGGAELPREAEAPAAPVDQAPVVTADDPAPVPENVAGTPGGEEAPTNAAIPPPPPYVPDPSWPTPPEGMVYVPGGEGVFTREGSEGSTTRRVEPFFIDRTEVTVAAFTACVRERRCDPYVRPTEGLTLERVPAVRDWEIAQCNYGRDDRQDHPMNCVSWREAGRYCIANGGELPTPDQWEFAARGHDAPFLWGEYEAPPGPLANLRDQSHRRTFLELADGQGNYAVRHYLPFDDGYPATAPVAVFPHDLGRFGAMDMASNVAEWLYSMQRSPVTNEREYALGGSHWNSGSVSSLQWSDPVPGIMVGLRCVRALR